MKESTFTFEATQDNHIEIVGVSRQTGQFEIIGVGGTTLNGRTDPIVVNAMGNSANFGDIAYVETDLGLRANLGKGNDIILVSRVEFLGDSLIYGGPGDDSVGMHQAEFPNDITIQTFTGDDSIAFNNSILRGETRLFSLDGEDTIGFDSVSAYGDTLVVTGNNNDRVVTDRSTFVGNTLILTQAGNDFVSVGDDVEFNIPGGLQSKAKRVFMGSGNDTLVGTEPFFNRVVNVFSGQEGFDSIEIEISDLPDNNIVVRSFEQNTIEDSLDRVEKAYDDLILNRALLAFPSKVIATIPGLSTFSGALEALELTGRSNTLGKAVFAPTDAAFEALAPGTLDALSESELLDLINFHRASLNAANVGGNTPVNESQMYSRDLIAPDQIYTFSGESVVEGILGAPISIEDSATGPVLNGNARLVLKDFRTIRGVIHVIDTVLIPAES